MPNSEDQTIQTNSMRGDIKEEMSEMTIEKSEKQHNDLLDKFVLERSIIYEEMEDQYTDSKPRTSE